MLHLNLIASHRLCQYPRSSPSDGVGILQRTGATGGSSRALHDAEHPRPPTPARPAVHRRSIKRPSFALMQAAGRPQRRGRGWETPAAAAARGPARCRDRRPGVLRRAAPLGDREPRLGRHHANGARRAAAGPRAGLKDQCRRPSRGHPLARWRLRPRRRRATHADGTRCGRIPLSPHQVNRRVQVLATALGLEGVSSHSGRRGLAAELVRRGASTTAVQAAGGWRSPAMVARYASAVAVEDDAVARLFRGGA